MRSTVLTATGFGWYGWCFSIYSTFTANRFRLKRGNSREYIALSRPTITRHNHANVFFLRFEAGWRSWLTKPTGNGFSSIGKPMFPIEQDLTLSCALIVAQDTWQPRSARVSLTGGVARVLLLSRGLSGGVSWVPRVWSILIIVDRFLIGSDKIHNHLDLFTESWLQRVNMSRFRQWYFTA